MTPNVHFEIIYRLAYAVYTCLAAAGSLVKYMLTYNFLAIFFSKCPRGFLQKGNFSSYKYCT